MYIGIYTYGIVIWARGEIARDYTRIYMYMEIFTYGIICSAIYFTARGDYE